LPSGPAPLAVAAPEGLCRCCAPAAPLARQGDTLACAAQPHNRYQRQGDQLVLLPATAAPTAEALATIDAALRRNNARVMINGLFDLD
jgi:hypothetical protein